MFLYWWAEAIYIQGYWKMCSISCNLICLVGFNYIFSNFSAVSITSLLFYWVGLNRFSPAFCSFIPLMKFIPSHALTIDAVCLLLQCWLDGYRLPWCVFVLRCYCIFFLSILKESFVECSTLGWQIFSFRDPTILFHTFLVLGIADEGFWSLIILVFLSL